MKSATFFFMIVLLVITQAALVAQQTNVKGLEGYWRMKNAAELTENNSLMLLLAQTDVAFVGTFKRTETQTSELTGLIYEGNIVTAVENSSLPQKNVYSGKIMPNGTIVGTFYSAATNITGEFMWERVCDGGGNPVNGYATPCVQMQTYTTRTVKELRQVPDTTVWVGEPRNENIPLLQGSDYIPPGAIYAGHINLDAMVTYRTVEVEVPIAEPVTGMFKYNDEQIIKGTVMPVTTFSPDPNKPKKGLEICDPGTANPNAPKTPAEKGITVKEGSNTYHIVGKGETMYAIAKHYGTTIEQLAELNGKECERINIGEKLRVK